MICHILFQDRSANAEDAGQFTEYRAKLLQEILQQSTFYPVDLYLDD